jgi:uncharacterized protein
MNFRAAALARTLVCSVCVVFYIGLAPRVASASAAIEELSERAARGDPAALDALVEAVRKRKDADAEYALGLLAYEGRGLARNGRQAFSLVERAAAKGHAEAANLLGYFHEHGIGTPVNPALALASYRRGAEAGSARARANLGWYYEHGIAIGKDPAIAADWYKLAAEQGLAAAHANLAGLYASGSGVDRNTVIAIALYEQALAGGIASAALALGRLLEERGKLAEASDHYVLAAKANVADADYEAGRLLVAPDNPRRDLAQGVHWLEQAAARSHREAGLLLARVLAEGGAAMGESKGPAK